MTVADASLAFLHQYGYAALFVLLTLETAMILRFVPSELMLGLAAVALGHSTLSLALVILDGALAMTVGSYLLYAASRYGGRAFLLRHPHWFHVTPARLERLDALFRRPAGELAVGWSRTLPIVRTWASIPAGIARMDATRFSLYSFAGHVVFATWVVWLVVSPAGRAVGDAVASWPLRTWAWIVALVIVAVVLVGGAWLYARARRRSEG